MFFEFNVCSEDGMLSGLFNFIFPLVSAVLHSGYFEIVLYWANLSTITGCGLWFPDIHNSEW